MKIDNLLEKYKSKKFNGAYNIKYAPCNKISLIDDDAESFNALYQEVLGMKKMGFMNDTVMCQSNVPSQSVFYWDNNYNSYNSNPKNKKSTHRHLIIRNGNAYKFLVRTQYDDNITKIPGRFAWLIIIEIAKEKFPDAYKEIQKYTVDVDTLAEIKEDFEDIYTGILDDIVSLDSTVYKHCYHIDLNSAYPSGMMATHPALKPLIEYIYNKRFEEGYATYQGTKFTKKEYWKGILNRFWGFAQSEYNMYPCPQLSKDALAWSNKEMRRICLNLRKEGYIPLLACTDAIWYMSPKNTQYHDDHEGSEMGQWKCDKRDCELRIRGPKAYDYRFINDNGEWEYKVTLSGRSNLEKIIPRDKWTWEDNYLFTRDDSCGEVITFAWNEKVGYEKRIIEI